MKLTHGQLYGAAWQRLRRMHLALHPYCVMCLKRTIATIVDHIRPHRGDIELLMDPDNLQSLCKYCHDSKKQRMEKSGIIKGVDVNGKPLDPDHPWNK
jgi:5-methylcytosine-specific restriction endonuclease McrA